MAWAAQHIANTLTQTLHFAPLKTAAESSTYARGTGYHAWSRTATNP